MNLFRRGFTLVELLVVISIIGVLVSIVAINSNSARRQSRDARRKADMQNVAGALELYRATNRQYPMVNYAGLKSTLQVFSSDIPSDPIGRSDGDYDNGGYFYYSDGKKFALDTRLENTSETTTLQQSPVTPKQPSGPNDLTFYQTGVYSLGGFAHYRVSGP